MGVPALLRRPKRTARLVAERLGIDHDEVLLTSTVGLEDAPEKVIKTDRHIVGKAAVDTDEHGLVTNAIHR